jgi:argininosuccinate lyase
VRWHPAYTERVLEPDYGFASKYLFHHFVDALLAHVRAVRALEAFGGRQADFDRLESALIALHDEEVPGYQAEVPDLYFAIHSRLERNLGEGVAGLVRLGLSRNDLDMTVYKMRAREVLLQLGELLCALRAEILAQVEQHVDTVLVAYTHHRPGQPTTVAHYLAAIENALARDVERLVQVYARLNTCPLGAAALAGSSYGLDRHATARRLGFAAPVSNTYDAVASSDWQVDIVAAAQSTALTLSRFVCDLLGWSSSEVFVLPDSLTQGSSIMPQKRNPVALEHARTRFSRALGASQMVLYSSHNIPYADLNDFGPDIQGALQALFLQLSGGLELLKACLSGGRFDAEVLARHALDTDTTATELADELVKQAGFSFPKAHALVGALVVALQRQGRALRQATVADLCELGGPAIDEAFLRAALEPLAFIRRRNGYGGPAPEVMHAHMTGAAARLDQDKAQLADFQHALQVAHRDLTAPERI